MEPLIVRLRNINNHMYVGSLGVGDQVLSVSFDTSIPSDIWIIDRAYHFSPTFNPEPGTQGAVILQNENTVLLGRNTALLGRRRTKNIMLGYPPYQVGACEFFIYTDTDPSDYCFEQQPDGFVGLGLPIPANLLPAPTFGPSAEPLWMTLMNQGLRMNVFLLYLRNYHVSDNDGDRIIFGGDNRSHFNGEHRYYSLVANAYRWMIHMYSVSVAWHLAQYCDKALIDSGSKYIYGPPHIIHAINRQILNREVPLYETTFLDVDEGENALELPEVVFTLGNHHPGEHSFNILPQHYTDFDEETGRYSTLFRPRDFQGEEHDYFILGLPWLRRYHTVFDFGQRRIGFANAVV